MPGLPVGGSQPNENLTVEALRGRCRVKRDTIMNRHVPALREWMLTHNDEAQPIENGPGRECVIHSQSRIDGRRLRLRFRMRVPETYAMKPVCEKVGALLLSLIQIEGDA